MRKLTLLPGQLTLVCALTILIIQACSPHPDTPELTQTPSSPIALTATLKSVTTTPSVTLTPTRETTESPVIPTPTVLTVKPTVIPPTEIPPTPTRIIYTSAPNIILIIVDALRADHVSSYGYSRTTTPNLDSLMAEEGVLFTDVSSSAPWTCPSNASIMTGRLPSAIGVNWQTLRNSVPQRENSLAEILHDAGYYTVGFANTYCLKGRLGFSQGFDIYDDTLSDYPTSSKARAELVNNQVKAWFSQQGQQISESDQPLFMFIYYFDPHGWYDPLPPYDTLFDSGYNGILTPDIYRDGQVVVSGEIEPSERDLQHLLAMYDGEIAYWDYHLGKLWEYLEEKGVFNNALIVVTADHGELFGEHNLWAHGNNLYEEVLRVPLLFRYSGVIYRNEVITAPVQSMDLMPTILEFAGVSPPDNLHAESLHSSLLNSEVNMKRTIFSEVAALNDNKSELYWTSPRFALRSVRFESWKLINHVNHNDSDELYFLALNSLYELENLVLSKRNKVEELYTLLP